MNEYEMQNDRAPKTLNHLLVFTRHTPKSSIYYSIKKPSTLIIFIHGFAGHHIKTWGDFRDVVLEYPVFAECDIIFYQYESTRFHMSSSALKLYSYLKIWTLESGQEEVLSRGKTEYKELIIVAHSLGALIARQALLFANADGCEWINKCRMLLFAPAHKGARIVELALKCLPAKYAGLAFIAHWFMPVLGDLKEDSSPIKEVIARTEALLKDGKGEFTKAFLTVQAIRDKIVIGGLYCSDPAPEADLIHDHVTVCKPQLPNFDTPIKYLISALMQMSHGYTEIKT